jgi:hypothetical protein
LHDRFQEWESLGVFEQLMTAMVGYYAKARRVKWKWQALDAKSCPSPLGGEATGKNPTARGKQGSKIHLLVDERGAPLALALTGANRHDSTAALDLIAAMVVPRPKTKQHLCADKAYDTLEIRDFLGFQDYVAHIKSIHVAKVKVQLQQNLHLTILKTVTQLGVGSLNALSLGWLNVVVFALVGAKNKLTGLPSFSLPVLIFCLTSHF